MTETHSSSDREGLKWVKIRRFLALPFCPDRCATYLAIKRFEDAPIDQMKSDGIEGVLVDADGTLGPHHSREYSASVVSHIKSMQEAGLKVAIYTNAFEDRFSVFEGVGVVTHVAPKPDPEGFLKAMRDHLHLEDPAKVVMIGDNYITDGGAVDAGMRFIHVKPVPGCENAFHDTTRYLAELIARSHRGPQIEK